MDVYSPPDPASHGEPRPAVVFVNGVGDRPGGPNLRTWGQYTSWPRLIAAWACSANVRAALDRIMPPGESVVTAAVI